MSSSTVTRAFQNMISIASSHLQTYSGSTEFGVVSTTDRNSVFSRLNGTGSFKDNNNQNLSANTYYKYILKIEGTTVTATIKDMQNNIKYSNSMTVSFAQDHKKWSIIIGDGSHTVKWKNLKIKPL